MRKILTGTKGDKRGRRVIVDKKRKDIKRNVGITNILCIRAKFSRKFCVLLKQRRKERGKANGIPFSSDFLLKRFNMHIKGGVALLSKRSTIYQEHQTLPSRYFSNQHDFLEFQAFNMT